MAIDRTRCYCLFAAKAFHPTHHVINVRLSTATGSNIIDSVLYDHKEYTHCPFNGAESLVHTTSSSHPCVTPWDPFYGRLCTQSSVMYWLVASRRTSSVSSSVFLSVLRNKLDTCIHIVHNQQVPEWPVSSIYDELHRVTSRDALTQVRYAIQSTASQALLLTWTLTGANLIDPGARLRIRSK